MICICGFKKMYIQLLKEFNKIKLEFIDFKLEKEKYEQRCMFLENIIKEHDKI